MIKKRRFVLLIVGVSLVAVSLILSVNLPLFEEQNRPEGYTNISSSQLSAMMPQKDFVLINVHVPYDGEIEGTDLFIPYNEIAKNPDKLPPEKDAKIVVYCRSGSMSTVASRELVQLGYTKILNLQGGMIGWENSGYPLIRR